MRSTLICLTVLLLGFSVFLFPLPSKSLAAGQSVPASIPIKQNEKISLSQVVHQAQILTLDINQLRQSGQPTQDLSLETAGGHFDLLLQPHSLLAPGYHAEEEATLGNRTPLPRPTITTFKGKVAGRADSQVRLTLNEQGVEGFCRMGTETFYLEPMTHFSDLAAPNQFAWYRHADLKPIEMGSCGTVAQRVEQTARSFEDAALEVSPTVNRVVELATEADFEYVQGFGGAQAANAEILSILNQVDGVYEAELGLTLQITYQHAFVTGDQPLTSNDPATLLSQFQTHWFIFNDSVNRDTAHLWTGKNLTGLIGLANIGATCSNLSGYGLSKRFDPLPTKFILPAHEIGHNLGAWHTEDDAIPHPECGQTVMNGTLTPSTAFTFCSFSRTQIQDYVAANSSCLTLEGAVPAISQFYPVASTGGKTISVFGNGFLPGTQVFFGDARRVPAANVQVVSPTQMEVTVPASNSTNNINGFVTVSVPGFPELTSQNFSREAANPGSPAAVFPEFVLLGDVNRDGAVQTNDLTLARAILNFQLAPSARQILAVDVVPANANGSRGNGQLTATDFTFLRAVLFGQAAF